jgi:hypothetical protein
MPILLSNFVWEGLSTEMPTYEEGARDGHIYKQLDTGESYIRRDNEWQFINLGLAYIKATKSGSLVTDTDGMGNIVFNTPFIDKDYTVALTCADPGNRQGVIAYTVSKEMAGFTVVTRDAVSGRIEPNAALSWLCTRNYDP